MKEKPLCMCCLSAECYKDMSNEYFYGEEQKSERYDELLLNTFNINVPSSEIRCLICEDCVGRLREASSFKSQCLKAQAAINEKRSWLKTEGNVIEPKEEKVEYDDFDDKLNDNISDDYLLYSLYDSKKERKETQADDNNDRRSIDGGIESMVIEMQEDLKPQKKLTTSIASGNKNKIVASKKNGIRNIKRKGTDLSVKVSNKKIKKGKAKTIEKSLEQIEQEEAEKLKNAELSYNSLKLIEHSNICLYRSHRPKYGCYICHLQFFNITDLRVHNDTHTNRLKIITLRFNQLRGLSYKNVDISNLKCNICLEPLKNLIELTNHLIKNHEIPFQGTQTDNFLIPYNLESFQCVLCGTNFNSYLKLSIHMNIHYANNICETCGSTFINRLNLRTHRQTMHKERQCAKCSEVFYTLADRVKHMRKVHNTQPNSKRHCLICGKTFRYTYLLDLHKIDEHGAEKPTPLKCDDCSKVFNTNLGLRTHIRCVHLKERNYSCTLCSMAFFTSTDQRRHERTHQDNRSFACSYCTTTFKSKDSWRRHLKRQHGHEFEPAYNRQNKDKSV